MTKSIKEILVEAILGDAHIGKTGLNRAFITFEQSAKKSEYLTHLHKLINEEQLALKEPKLYIRTDERYNTINQSLYFRTNSIEDLKPLADLFLDSNNKKIIPTNISDYLTYKGLAYWIMDDGQ